MQRLLFSVVVFLLLTAGVGCGESQSVNYSFYPYVEIDGKEYKNAAVLLRFKDRAA